MDKLLELLAQKAIGPVPYWGILLLLFIIGLPYLTKLYRENLPGVFVFFSRLLKRPVPPQPKTRVFIGPRQYTETAEDRERYFGRDGEIAEGVAKLLEYPFFIIEGESGSGKSSLIRAGLLPKLQETFRVEIRRITYGKEETVWPLEGTSDESGPKPLLVIYDQFEELFVTAKDDDRLAFMRKLRTILERREYRICITLRQDFFDLLRRLCQDADPDRRYLDYRNYLTVAPFTEEQAEQVLTNLLLSPDEKELTPELSKFCKTLVQELLRPPRDTRLNRADRKTVLPVELQTIGMMLERL